MGIQEEMNRRFPGGAQQAQRTAGIRAEAEQAEKRRIAELEKARARQQTEQPPGAGPGPEDARGELTTSQSEPERPPDHSGLAATSHGHWIREKVLRSMREAGHPMPGEAIRQREAAAQAALAKGQAIAAARQAQRAAGKGDALDAPLVEIVQQMLDVGPEDRIWDRPTRVEALELAKELQLCLGSLARESDPATRSDLRRICSRIYRLAEGAYLPGSKLFWLALDRWSKGIVVEAQAMVQGKVPPSRRRAAKAPKEDDDRERNDEGSSGNRERSDPGEGCPGPSEQ